MKVNLPVPWILMAQAAAAVPDWGALGSWEQSTFGDPGDDGYSWWLL